MLLLPRRDLGPYHQQKVSEATGVESLEFGCPVNIWTSHMGEQGGNGRMPNSLAPSWVCCGTSVPGGVQEMCRFSTEGHV